MISRQGLTLVIALAAAALLPAAGAGVRLGLWSWQSGFYLLRMAFFAGLALAALALIQLLVPKWRAGRAAMPAVALVIGLATAYVPWHALQSARAYPPIHDLSTDTRNPPAFVAVLALRAGAPNPPEYAGERAAQAQRLAYPDLQPLGLAMAPEAAFIRALETAQAMGWQIVAQDPAEGRIEATATTFWFGFKDDVVIRIAPTHAGSRVDVRSKSRVGRGDAGANAKRIRTFLRAMMLVA
jgi:uncharacterized protein (DUF1499 family)